MTIEPRQLGELVTPQDAATAEPEPDEVVIAELLPLADAPAAAAAKYDPAEAAVLAALEQDAEEEIDKNRPRKTKTGYARDWQLWTEFHGWLAERTGTALPLTALTKGTLVAFVIWLDEVQRAAPNTIDRRITGVTVTARRAYNTQAPKEATLAARELVRRWRKDPARMARGRGQAPAATPKQLREMNTTDPVIPRRPGSRRRRREYVLPELARLRNRALVTMAFAIAARDEEVAALDAEHIVLVPEGLEVHVPSVKDRPPRDTEVSYGRYLDSCPVRGWLAWKEAANITTGPAFRSVDQWGHLGTGRLSPDACRLVITRAAERAALETRLTGHSMRAGFITTGRKAGKRPEQLRRQSGHSASSPVFWDYIRRGERWEDPASKDIDM